MKKLLLFLVVICTLLSFTACDLVDTVGKLIGRDDDSSENSGDSQENNNGSNNNGSTDNNQNTNGDGGNGDAGNADGGNGGNTDNDDTTTSTKADEWREEYDTITIDEAYDICDATGNGKSERYYLIATVISVDDAEYGKMMIKDSTGELLVYGSYGADGEDRYGELTVPVPKAGDVVLFYGNFKNYNGTREMYSGWIIDFYTPGSSGSGNSGSGSTGGNTGSGSGDTTSTKADEWREEYDTITIDEAYDICDATGNGKSERYYLIATVISVDDAQYGNMMIKDSTGELLVYGSYGADGEDRYGELTVAVPKAGDVVLFYGNFKNYNGTREMYSGWIIDFYTPGANDSGNGGSGNAGGNGGSTGNNYANTDFSASDKTLMNDNVGFVLPFIPCDEYGLEEYFETEGEYSYFGVYFYTVGNTEAEFEDYLELFASYTFDGTEDDEDGDTWYFYSRNDVFIDFVHYYYEGEYYLELYAYVEYVDEGDNGNSSNEGGNAGGNGGSTGNNYANTEFSASDKTLMNDNVGFVLPFIPCNEYGLEEYFETEGEYSYFGVYFYTVGNTEADFEAYLELFESYTFDGTEDDEGDTWYYYSNGDVYIDVIFYYYSGESYVELYAYTETEDSGNGDYNDYDVMTNEGAGLPETNDGVYEVDFTKAENVKDVTDQGLYIDGCPTTGSPAVLVIPVEFSDALASSKGYTTDAIENVFLKNGVNDYYSVYDYYYISSYGKLDLDITVLDFWFKPKYNSQYYYDATFSYYGEEMSNGEQLIIDEALAYLSGIMDLSEFDSDNNGIIDAIVLVNTLDAKEEDFYWAFRYWNLYTDAADEYYEYDGVSANDYVWAPYQFIYECYDEEGDRYFDDDTMNPYTYIHEFAHILGAEDYYDNAYVDHPMAGFDVMDFMIGDHNAYTKINLGWITTSRLVAIKEGSITLTLEDFSENGDTIIIANNWDEKLGAYQEYYVIVYYTNNALNGGGYGYFTNDGIVVYHVNSPLYSENISGEEYYYIYNTNTDPSDPYGTEDNLIEFVKTSNDTYVFLAGYTMPTVTDDFGNELRYTFTVVSTLGDEAVITFTVKA